MHMPSNEFTLSGKRLGNEDSILIDPELGLYIVADGVTHSLGKTCSQRACEEIQKNIQRRKAILDNYRQRPSSGGRRLIEQMLCAAIEDASNVLHVELNSADTEGVFACVALILVVNEYVFSTNLGDCRVYRILDGKFSLRTIDHTVRAAMKAAKKSEDEIRKSSDRNVILAAVGYRYTKPHVDVRQLFPGERLLLCTDGLSDYFDEGDFATPWAAEKSERLIESLKDFVKKKGEKDNATSIIVDCGPPVASKVGAAQESTVIRKICTVQNIHLFDHLKPDQVEVLLSYSDMRVYEPGTVVLEKGMFNNEMLIVFSGLLNVEVGPSGQIKDVRPGEVLGEISLFDGSPISTKVTAVQRSTVIVFSRDSLFELFRKHEGLAARCFLGLVQSMSHRMRVRTAPESEKPAIQGPPIVRIFEG